MTGPGDEQEDNAMENGGKTRNNLDHGSVVRLTVWLVSQEPLYRDGRATVKEIAARASDSLGRLYTEANVENVIGQSGLNWGWVGRKNGGGAERAHLVLARAMCQLAMIVAKRPQDVIANWEELVFLAGGWAGAPQQRSLLPEQAASGHVCSSSWSSDSPAVPVKYPMEPRNCEDGA